MYLKLSNSVSFFQYFFYFYIIFPSDVFLCWVTVRTQCLQKNYSQSKKSAVGGERPQDWCEILLNPFVPDAYFGIPGTVFSQFLKKCSNFHICFKITLVSFSLRSSWPTFCQNYFSYIFGIKNFNPSDRSNSIFGQMGKLSGGW